MNVIRLLALVLSIGAFVALWACSQGAAPHPPSAPPLGAQALTEALEPTAIPEPPTPTPELPTPTPEPVPLVLADLPRLMKGTRSSITAELGEPTQTSSFQATQDHGRLIPSRPSPLSPIRAGRTYVTHSWEPAWGLIGGTFDGDTPVALSIQLADPVHSVEKALEQAGLTIGIAPSETAPGVLRWADLDGYYVHVGRVSLRDRRFNVVYVSKTR